MGKYQSGTNMRLNGCPTRYGNVQTWWYTIIGVLVTVFSTVHIPYLVVTVLPLSVSVFVLLHSDRLAAHVNVHFPIVLV